MSNMNVSFNTTADRVRGLEFISNISDRNGLFKIDPGYTLLLFCTMGIAALFAAKQRTYGAFSTTREPPAVPHFVPFVGHLWGLLRYTHEYVNSLCEKTSHAIFSIPVLFGKAYIVSSPLFAQSIFRNKSVSMEPLVTEFVARIEDLSEPAKKAYHEGLQSKSIHLFAASLSGSERKRMAATALEELIRLLPEPCRPEGDRPNMCKDVQTQDLWLWLRSITTISTTSSLMGRENNPWSKDPSLVESYWTYEDGGFAGHMFDIAYRNSKKARNTMVDALEAYFTAGYDTSGDKGSDNHIASLTVDMAAMQRQYGFTTREIAATYVIVVHASLANVAPTLFWCVAYVFSRPSLLAQLRDELRAALTIEGKTAFVDADWIQSKCPLLVSVLNETQRLVSIGTLHRQILDDTTVSANSNKNQVQSWLLKKGTNLLISQTSAHRDPGIWGLNASEFDANRFLETQQSTTDKSSDEGLRKSAYYPFGGGKDRCPGRYFATTELLGSMAVLFSGYDITAVGGGPISQPEFGACKLTTDTARPHPDADLRVRVERRKGWEEVSWKVKNNSA